MPGTNNFLVILLRSSYYEAISKRFYKDDKKIIYRPIFLESKTKYNAKDKVKEINTYVKKYPGDTTVIYFIDVDDYDVNPETKKLYDDIVNYCTLNEYEFVFFTILNKLDESG